MAIPEHVLSASRLNRAKLKPKTSKCLFQNDPFVYFFDLTMNRLLPGVTIIGRVQVLQKNECQGRNQNLVGFQILPGEIKIGICPGMKFAISAEAAQVFAVVFVWCLSSAN